MPTHPESKPHMHLCGGDNAPDYAAMLDEEKFDDKLTKKLRKETK